VALLESSQGSGESCGRVMPSSHRLLRTVPACSFYSLKEVQGYKMLVCGRSLPRKQPWGLIWWRHGLYCRGMASVLRALRLHGEAGVPLRREWFLSFGIVAVRPVILGPIAGVAFRSL
jgi:hypothetical protein